MKSFQTVQANFKSIGIESSSVPFGQYKLKHIVVDIIAIILLLIHLAFVAETSREYMTSVFIITAAIFILMTYLNFRFNSKKIFKIIAEIQQTIDKSE